MDVLSDAITAMHTGRHRSARTQLHAPWGLRYQSAEGAGFHVVLRGTCWLIPPHTAPIALGPGDVVFMPHGCDYGLADSPSTPLSAFRLEEHDEAAPIDQVRVAGSGARTLMLCGAYQFNQARAHPLLADLPEVIHLPARVGRHPSLRAAIDLLGGELEEPRPGAGAVLPALIDVLLLYILRAWLDEQSGQTATGWAAALSDPAIAVALRS